MSEKPSKDLKVKVFSPETANIDKSANLTQTLSYGKQLSQFACLKQLFAYSGTPLLRSPIGQKKLLH